MPDAFAAVLAPALSTPMPALDVKDVDNHQKRPTMTTIVMTMTTNILVMTCKTHNLLKLCRCVSQAHLSVFALPAIEMLNNLHADFQIPVWCTVADDTQKRSSQSSFRHTLHVQCSMRLWHGSHVEVHVLH